MVDADMKTNKKLSTIAKEPFWFLVNYTILSSYNPSRFKKNLLTVTFSKKFKTSNKKIGQHKAQYILDRTTAEISALSSWDFNKYEFLTGKDVSLEKALLEKAIKYKDLNIHH